MRASKEILANEIGVVFNSAAKSKTDPANREGQGDAELVSTEGTVDGGVFRFRAAHFEWLLRIAVKLGLRFDDIGRRVHGTDSTLLFCDELIRLYGSEDYMTSQAASYAVENWAAAGFWDQLVSGLAKFNEQMKTPLPLAFFTWHARIEGQHAQHTQEELEELYFEPRSGRRCLHRNRQRDARGLWRHFGSVWTSNAGASPLSDPLALAARGVGRSHRQRLHKGL